MSKRNKKLLSKFEINYTSTQKRVNKVTKRIFAICANEVKLKIRLKELLNEKSR